MIEHTLRKLILNVAGFFQTPTLMRFLDAAVRPLLVREPSTMDPSKVNEPGIARISVLPSGKLT